MIGTIRKHSAWLWWVIAGLTIISFVVFMGSGPGRNGGRGGTGDFGTIYGRKVTAQEYVEARNAFYIFYRLDVYKRQQQDSVYVWQGGKWRSGAPADKESTAP